MAMEAGLLYLGLISPSCAIPGALFTPACLSLVVSKLLGYAIILGAFVVKVPQILKLTQVDFLLQSRSAEGVSNLMFMLELVGYVIGSMYGYMNRFAFNTYGETIFIALQNIIIIYLIVRYTRGSMALLVVYFAGLVGLAYAILTGIISSEQLTMLQGATIPIFAASKIPQILECFRLKSSGKLSLVTFMLNFAGSVARVFTTLKEVSDNVVLAGFISGAVLNGILTAQILVFGDRSVAIKTKKL